MEFDKNRIYTAVNADELKIGSKCIFADTVRGLRRKVEEDADCVETFYRLHNNGGDDLFVGNNYVYCYAYLIEPPAEPKYKPFEDVDKAMEVIIKHGGWVRRLEFEYYYLIKGCYFNGRDLDIYIDVIPYSAESLFCSFIFADDGSPCGELVEE